MSKIEIKNTICFDFGDGCVRPTLAEMANFVKTLTIGSADIEAVYRISEEKAVFVKCKSEEAMQNALRSNSAELDFKYANGKTVKICMSPAGGNIQYVRIYDLPPEISDRDLVAVLGIYGKVKRVIREKFPAELGLDVFTGVRGAYMDVQREIPPSLHFASRKGNIFYDGIKEKCFFCKTDGHHMKSCPKRKAKKTTEKQNEEQNGATYAGVVTGGEPLGNNEGNMEEMAEVISEEVLEMEAITEPEEPEDVVENTEPRQQQRVIRYRDEAKYKQALVQWQEQQKRYAEEDRLAAIEKQKKKELKALKKAGIVGNSPPRKNRKDSSHICTDTVSE